jgi:hypothetical protein
MPILRRVFETLLTLKSYTLYECERCGSPTTRRHYAERYGSQRFVEHEIVYRNSKKEGYIKRFCKHCLERNAIPCVWCGKAIFWGDACQLLLIALPVVKKAGAIRFASRFLHDGWWYEIWFGCGRERCRPVGTALCTIKFWRVCDRSGKDWEVLK